ncbi:DNA-directed RNA polymerase subunit omega [bacterium]|nr:DNA-directed RNA polymerase subunit omega [bacterium]
MNTLDLEKIVDKVGSKYEAVLRMSVIARRLANDGVNEENTGGDKITRVALNEYIEQNDLTSHVAIRPKE